MASDRKRTALRRLLRHDDGISLVVALGVMFVISIAAASAVAYTSSSSRQSSVDQNRQEAFALAEAGLTHALSVLANSADPRTAADFSSSAPITLEAGTYGYTAVRSGPVWTLTGIGTLPNPSGGAPLTKEVIRTVVVNGLAATPIPPEWDRIFQEREDKCVKLDDVTIAGPLDVAGDLCVEGEAWIDNDWLQVGGDVEVKGDKAWIGKEGDRIAYVAVSGICEWDKNKAKNEDCDETNRVYADLFDSTPEILPKPEIDWAYWFDNAMPGPRYACTEGTLPSKVPLGEDDELDGDSPKFNITPKNASYSCKVKDSAGYVLGELTWNHTTHVMNIKGVIFFDGDVNSTDDKALVNYQGKGSIYISGQWHNHEVWCAGGDGTHDCRSDMDDWDPTTNMLWIFAGADEPKEGHTDLNFHKDEGAFQGGLYARNKCEVKAFTSGPILCNELKLGKDKSDDGVPQHSMWPPLNIEQSGVVIPPTGGDYTLTLGPQYG